MPNLISAEDLVYPADDGQPMTTSLVVAQRFGKQHKDVLRAIRELECSPEFTQRNFALSEYTDSTGRSLPMARMTRDGFSFLVMGFTGSEAAQWKEKFLQAFRALEEQALSNYRTVEQIIASANEINARTLARLEQA